MNTPLSRDVARAAAHWLALIHSGEATAGDLADCARWRAAATEHELAWQRAERLAGMLGGLPGKTGVEVLNRKQRGGRRQFAKALLALLIAAPASYTAWRTWDDALVQQWTAQQRTGTGERRQLALADGGTLHLNSATAVDIDYNATSRNIRLLDGEILIETATDTGHQPPRPFIVHTAHGHVRALGTRFMVRSEGGAASGRTCLSVLKGAVEVTPHDTTLPVLPFSAGQQLRFNRREIGPVETTRRHADAWTRGLLVAENLRLADFTTELARHYRGIVRVDPAVADLRITGAYQLDHIDAALAALPHTLPVQVVHRTRWWISIVPAQT